MELALTYVYAVALVLVVQACLAGPAALVVWLLADQARSFGRGLRDLGRDLHREVGTEGLVVLGAAVVAGACEAAEARRTEKAEREAAWWRKNGQYGAYWISQQRAYRQGRASHHSFRYQAPHSFRG